MIPLAVLDTHAWVWWMNGSPELGGGARHLLERAGPERPVLVPDVCLWEVATLASLGRLRLAIRLEEWLLRASAPPLVEVVPITPAIAAEVASLPDSFHRDPADRLIVSTARSFGLPLLTADARIRDSGLVRVVW